MLLTIWTITGFKWAKAEAPSAEVISCWDDNADTEIVDHHQYSANWGINNAVLNNVAKGGVVTEGGSRFAERCICSADDSALFQVVSE